MLALKLCHHAWYQMKSYFYTYTFKPQVNSSSLLRSTSFSTRLVEHVNSMLKKHWSILYLRPVDLLCSFKCANLESSTFKAPCESVPVSATLTTTTSVQTSPSIPEESCHRLAHPRVPLPLTSLLLLELAILYSRLRILVRNIPSN